MYKLVPMGDHNSKAGPKNLVSFRLEALFAAASPASGPYQTLGIEVLPIPFVGTRKQGRKRGRRKNERLDPQERKGKAEGGGRQVHVAEGLAQT